MPSLGNTLVKSTQCTLWRGWSQARSRVDFARPLSQSRGLCTACGKGIADALPLARSKSNTCQVLNSNGSRQLLTRDAHQRPQRDSHWHPALSDLYAPQCSSC